MKITFKTRSHVYGNGEREMTNHESTVTVTLQCLYEEKQKIKIEETEHKRKSKENGNIKIKKEGAEETWENIKGENRK
jgi:hypothetical protein